MTTYTYDLPSLSPDPLKLVAPHRFGFLSSLLNDSETISPKGVAPTPIPTPTTTPPPTPTTTPPPTPTTTPPPTPTTTLTPLASPNPAISPTLTLALPSVVLPFCPHGKDFKIHIKGQAGTGFLVYFDDRPVGGGVIHENGINEFILIVGDEVEGIGHRISARIRGTNRQLEVSLPDGSKPTTPFQCVVPNLP